MYEFGTWNAICDRCGGTRKAHQLRVEWTGFRVCSKCYDPAHPQDSIRAKPDRQAPPWVRPEQEGIDVSPGSGNEISADDL